MTKFVAKFGLFTASFALMFANYWFTFGLWPKSWLSFTLCAIGGITIIALQMAVESDK